MNSPTTLQALPSKLSKQAKQTEAQFQSQGIQEQVVKAYEFAQDAVEHRLAEETDNSRTYHLLQSSQLTAYFS